jgi:flagellar hook-basal body complex protein FliE
MEISNGRTDINAVLAQMRQMRMEATRELDRSMSVPDVAVREGQQIESPGFGDLLKQAVDSVNDMQKTASQGVNDFVEGRETNLVKVMVESQKASVGFQAMVQARNRMVSAYQDIMKMPI